MKYTTKNVNINGTSGRGNIETSYQQLVDAFGQPTGRHDDYKCDAEWDIQFNDGTIATIYNWKNGINYCGRDGTPTEQITYWSIGGNDDSAVDKVTKVLTNNKRKRIEVSYE